MIFTAWADGWLDFPDTSAPGKRVRCALGPAGVKAHKREGDSATPAGAFPLRRVLFRPDRGAPPATALPASPLSPTDGWCDEPADTAYNRPVALPYPAGAEALWRDDGIYDLIVLIGHNDDPVVPDAGSAVFLHLAREDYAPTRGCVALARPDLEVLLGAATVGDVLAISEQPAPAR
jgi:L,D-peptidoglycan transpeptidase YkuD (ErfK/YbiS/YcfS/YnhG family)